MRQNKSFWLRLISLFSSFIFAISLFIYFNPESLQLILSISGTFFLFSTILVLLVVDKYKQKINEIFYLRRLLSDGNTDQDLSGVDGQSISNQLGLLLFPYILTLIKVLWRDTQKYSPVDQHFPIVLKNERKERILFKVEEIEWIRACGNHQEIKTTEGVFKVKHTMKHIETLLNTKSDRFVKVHRSWIINIDMVRVVAPNWTYIKIKDKLISISENYKEKLSFRLFWYNPPMQDAKQQLI